MLCGWPRRRRCAKAWCCRMMTCCGRTKIGRWRRRGSATGLDNALNMLGMEEKEKSKNLKVLFNEFSERETPKVRADNPGLKPSQVKERVFRAWEKSPENPKNQVA